MQIEWNPAKNRGNQAKHGISFEEAAQILGDPMSKTIADPLHSDREDRLVTLGMSKRGRLLVVVHTDRGDAVRLISARKATTRERVAYEEET